MTAGIMTSYEATMKSNIGNGIPRKSCESTVPAPTTLCVSLYKQASNRCSALCLMPNAVIWVGGNYALQILLRLRGGAKKRKKKNYTKPKKKRHLHKKIRLRVLEHYKVEDSGSVTRLRQQCPQCGPGISMATHFDRVYCG